MLSMKMDLENWDKIKILPYNAIILSSNDGKPPILRLPAAYYIPLGKKYSVLI